jgi:hypothetical protein
MTEWSNLDEQIGRWAGRLRDDALVPFSECRRLASAIATELTEAPDDTIRRLADASPVPVQARLDELVAFQAFSELINEVRHPAVIRARVIAQCYICFVYLKDRWFVSLAEAFPRTAAVALVARYLTSGRVRSFRNAFAHGNWRYAEDFSGIEFWDRGSTAPDKVSQDDMDFWQTLSRCVAYVSIQVSARRAV